MSSKKERKLSIKAKLLGTIIPVVLVVVFLLIVIAYSVSKNIIKDYATNQLSLSVKNQESQIEAWINRDLASFEVVKKNIEGSKPDDATLASMLDLYYGYDSDFPDGLYVASEDGTIIKAAESSKTSSNVTDEVWYNEGLSRVNMQFGSAYKNSSGGNYISATGIINDGSDSLRVLAADVSLDHVSLIVNSMVDMESAESVLVDTSSGTILAARDAATVFTNIAQSSDPILSAISASITKGDYSPTEAGGCIIAFQQIANTDWLLASDIPTDVIYNGLNRLRVIMIVVGIIAVLCIIVLVERMTHMVVKPVKKLTEDIVKMAAGDFTVQIETKGNDEIAAMGRSVQKFVSSMRNMIADINSISGRLGQQAEGSTEVSREMFDASLVQADSMQKLNVTVDNLSISVSEIARSASTLASVVADAKEDTRKVDEKMQLTIAVSKQGQKDMEKINLAMNEIAGSISNLEEAVNKVGHASEEITSIVSVIGNIADETTLLSLNASIEAARAGEQGRGFAVVASEIAKLANTCADSVATIGSLIEDVKGLVSETIEKSHESVTEIRSSSELVIQAITTFNSIFENIEETNVYISDMIEKVDRVSVVATDAAAISEEQAASTEEISNTAGSMVSHANNISKNSEIVADDAKSLASTAEVLEQQMRMFRF